MPNYEIFSKRDKPLPDVFQTDTIPEKLRTQIVWIWKRSLLTFTRFNEWERNAATNDLLSTIRDFICEKHGLSDLSEGRTANVVEDFLQAFRDSDNTQFVLDMIEVSFRMLLRSAAVSRGFLSTDLQEWIDDLNHRFRENGVGYQFDPDARMLIPMNNVVTHEEIVRPTLHLLSHPQYKTANEEYLEAWKDFKKADYPDCLTKCNSSFESVMKITCHQKGWPHQQTDTASTLLRTIDAHTSGTDFPTFLTTPLTLIATLRNKLSSSHGSGTVPQTVPEHLARYALNATASAILLVTEAVK